MKKFLETHGMGFMTGLIIASVIAIGGGTAAWYADYWSTKGVTGTEVKNIREDVSSVLITLDKLTETVNAFRLESGTDRAALRNEMQEVKTRALKVEHEARELALRIERKVDALGVEVRRNKQLLDSHVHEKSLK